MLMKYCEKCGNKMADDALFCSKCGRKSVDFEAADKEEAYENKSGNISENKTNAPEEVQTNARTQCQAPSSDSEPVKKKSGCLKGCALIFFAFLVFIIFCSIIGSCVANQSDSSGSTSSKRTNTSQVSPETEAEYKASCKSYDYDSIERRPADYAGKRAVFKCVVNQVIENGNTIMLRVGVPNSWDSWKIITERYDKEFRVTYTKKSSNEDRILEDDVIRIYGELNNTTTYETVLHAQRTIPDFKAKYIEIIGKTE